MKHLLYKLSGWLYCLPINNPYLLAAIYRLRQHFAPFHWYTVTSFASTHAGRRAAEDLVEELVHAGVPRENIGRFFDPDYDRMQFRVLTDYAGQQWIIDEFIDLQ